MAYAYQVVPFITGLKLKMTSSDDLTKVALALQELIQDWSDQGWEFYRMEQVEVTVSRSFMNSLVFGNGSSNSGVVNLDLVVFRAPKA